MQKIRLFPKGETWASVIWMLFLLIPMIDLFPFNTLENQLLLLLLLLFACFYRNTLFQKKYFLYWLCGQYVIAFFYLGIKGYVHLFMFPAWQLGFSKLGKRTFFLMYGFQLVLIFSGALLTSWLNLFPLSGGELISSIVFGLFTAFAPIPGREFYYQNEKRKQLYQANQRLEQAIKGEERNRIARDLHDSLGQSLSVITLKVELSQRMLKKDSAFVLEELAQIQQLSRSTLATVREIVSDMRNQTIPQELIISNQALTAANIIMLTEGEVHGESLSKKQQSEFSNVLREAITNIVRHSQASFCSISFSKNDNALLVVIQDNGIGLKKTRFGNGMKGMQERIKNLSGSMVVQEERGTVLRFQLPLQGGEG